MKKSYEDLQKEHSATLIEMAKIANKLDTLAISLQKRDLPETLKKAKKYIHKFVWMGKSLLYVESVELRGTVHIKTFQIDPDGLVYRQVYECRRQNDYLLQFEPFDSEHLMALYKDATQISKEWRQILKEQYDASRTAGTATATSTDKTS